jgi:hypothetical protein
MKPTRTIVVLFLLLGGCGSCQRGGEAPGAGESSSNLQAPVVAPGKIQVAPLQPNAGSRRIEAQGGVQATPIAPAAGAGAGEAAPPAAPAEDESNDCVVVADVNPDYGTPPLAVSFTAEAECSSGLPSYKWNFGDNSSPSTEPNPSHTYTQPGDFTASVTVTSPSGATATDEVDITVEEDDSSS